MTLAGTVMLLASYSQGPPVIQDTCVTQGPPPLPQQMARPVNSVHVEVSVFQVRVKFIIKFKQLKSDIVVTIIVVIFFNIQ